MRSLKFKEFLDCLARTSGLHAQLPHQTQINVIKFCQSTGKQSQRAQMPRQIIKSCRTIEFSSKKIASSPSIRSLPKSPRHSNVCLTLPCWVQTPSRHFNGSRLA